MAEEEPLAKITIFVPELPFGTESLRCMHREDRTRSVIYTLADGTVCSVYRRGTLTERWCPESKVGWYLKITGRINIYDLKFVLNFLKLYKKEMKIMLHDSGIFWSILDKLRKGVSCEDIRTLQGALLDALAVKTTELKLGPPECVRCGRVKPYGPLPCEHEYINKKRKIKELRYEFSKEFIEAKD